MASTFVREKKIYCGENYLEVDIFQYTETQVRRKKRSKREKETLLTQQNLNDKNAKRKFIQLAETNFNQDDLHVTLTYSDKYLPKTIKEAEKEIENYFKRIRNRRKKENLDDLKYMIITEYSLDNNDGITARPHHHILMNGGLDRDEVEKIWSRRKRKGEKEGERIGYANADRLQLDYNSGLQRLSEYLTRHSKRKKKYSCSKNLKRPESRTNDSKYSRRRLIKSATEEVDIAKIERLYPGWTIKDKDKGFTAIYNEMTGWSVYLKLRRKEERRRKR